MQRGPRSEPTPVSVDERRAQGRARRAAVPRSAHAGWKAAADRRDPLELLLASNEGRIAELVPIRFGRMAASPFAFYRRAAALMAADLATTPASGLRVQACGDAHLMNFGGFATPERNVVFDINDLDETLPAPWEWDLKRLATSFVIAARHLGLKKGEGVRIAAAVACRYREKMADYAAMRALDVWYDRIDLRRYEDGAASARMRKAIRSHFAERVEAQRRKEQPEHMLPRIVSMEGALPRIKDEPPLIYHPDADLAPGLATGFTEAGAAYRASLPEHLRALFARFRVVDYAIKVVGVGSVGTMCSVALFMAAGDDPLFLQIKEARASVLEPYAGRSVHRNHGERIVVGQRLMQSASDVFLGWTRGTNGRDMYVRQLRDMKIAPNIDGADATQLRLYGRLCAHALARAHARSGDAAAIAGYLGSSGAFDDAIGAFAVDYAAQNEADFGALRQAIDSGRIAARAEIG